ncbi:MAG: hypothetical protein ACI9W7_000162 [Porticoccaceae bacterium]|jgi:hypothetical protein|tara:strand:- start:402 stop:1001 length:600 start_codon:yes stop_codon:yes gene_type:complete
MSLTTYDGLKASIANWLNRTDLTSEIPDFIALAEDRLSQEVRVPTIEKTAAVILDANGAVTIPADFLELKYAFYNENPLERVSLTELRGYVKTSGDPVIFAREARQFVFQPIPTMTATDRLIFIYYKDVPALSALAPTNELLEMAPQLYLYSSLVEASNFLGSDPSRWETSYQSALSRLLLHARSAEFAGSTPQISSGY